MSCSDEYISHTDTQNLIQISPLTKAKLKKAKYGVYNHSAVELCHWTKKSFSNEGTCYKHKFYGISTHRCMEMTPTAMNCENRCIYCWRPSEFYDTLEMPEHLVDEPDMIINNLLEERRKLIVGHYGNKKCDNSKSIFLVTNGQEPEMLQRLVDEKALPTQLYLSTNASNKKMYTMVNRPKYKDAWERWQKSLELLSELDTRTVLRMTLIRNFNDSTNSVNEFANLVKRGNPHFIEIKSYMHIGMSTQRLERSDMLEMHEIKDYSDLMCSCLDSFSIMDESEISRIVVLQNHNRYTVRWIEGYEKPIIH